ncbi:MAG TPA: chorismate mutase, partial [Candidatus Nitrosocosmicus sp.]|nr:chorismate mutase [Candidatus Nitrosocosmicus sp.]
MSRNESVDVLRKKIDQIDEKVVALLNDRAFLAQKIGHSKSQNNQEVYVPHREKQILQRLSRLNQGPLPEHSIRAIFREVVSACRSIEAPLKIAFFGAEGTYSHLAAREKFGSTVTLLPTASISEVFQEVSQERVSFGVVPIENSTEGVVAHTLDVLVDSELKICAEIYLEIHHNLLSRTGREQDVKRIVSHPQALAQCRQWLTRHLSTAKLDEVASTAHAAMIAAGDRSVG